MIRNQAGQVVRLEVIDLAGAPFTGAVSVKVQVDTAAQAPGSVGGGAYSPSFYVKYFENAAAVSVITCNDGGGQYEFSVVEVSGLATSSSLDQAAGYHLDAATTAYTAAAITTTVADEIVFGVHVASSSGTFSGTPSGSFVTTVMNASQSPSGQVQHQIVSSTGTYTSAGVWSSAPSFTDSAMVSFKGAGGGGGLVCTPTISTLGVGRCGDDR